jgi:hypothetical protein
MGRDDVEVSPEARAGLKDYIDNEKGTGRGRSFSKPTWQTHAQERCRRLIELDLCHGKRKVPVHEHINLYVNLMRRTALKQADQNRREPALCRGRKEPNQTTARYFNE